MVRHIGIIGQTEQEIVNETRVSDLQIYTKQHESVPEFF